MWFHGRIDARLAAVRDRVTPSSLILVKPQVSSPYSDPDPDPDPDPSPDPDPNPRSLSLVNQLQIPNPNPNPAVEGPACGRIMAEMGATVIKVRVILSGCVIKVRVILSGCAVAAGQ